ncbi:MAG: tyrosine-type recombinase/integrase [Candidatus Bathyarchaeia archaeon]
MQTLNVEPQVEDEVKEFLSVHKSKQGTYRTYKVALDNFREFYMETEKKTISYFLSQVEEDLQRHRLQKTRVARKTLNAFVAWLQEKGKSPKTINVYVGVVQSLAKYYDIPMSLRFVSRPPTVALHKKHPWTIEEVAKFVDMMDNIQYKSIATAIVQSGLSISDLLALTYGDIREEFEKSITPLCLDLSRVKTSVPFMTFLGGWALDHLNQHLANRTLKDNTPIYQVTSRAVHLYFRKVGQRFDKKSWDRNPCSPHSLRAAFRTILSDHKIDHIIIEFWMGHRVPEQQIVYVSKSREGWRETYRSLAEPHLTPSSLKRKT